MIHLRCLSWATVSSEEQADSDKFSIPTQLADNREFIDTLTRRYPAYTGQLVAELTVERSRKIIELSEARRIHPSYETLYSMIQSHAFDLLVCRRRDRLGREESLIITLESLCLANGIVVAACDSLPPTLDARALTNDEGWRVTTMIQAWQSGAYVRDLSTKVTAGRRERVLNLGRFIAAPPYGYRLVRDEDDKKRAIVDVNQSAIVRRILLDWYLGQSWGAPRIRDELNALGIVGPNGGRWHLSSVSGIILRARVYAGDVAYGRSLDDVTQWTEGAHEPILTREELARVLAERDSRGKGQRRTYALSGIVICAECDGLMYGCFRKQFRYYFCRVCGYSGREDRIVAQLHAAVDELIHADTEAILRAVEADVGTSDIERQIAQQVSTLRELEAVQGRLLDAYESGMVPLDVLSQRMAEKRRQMEEIVRLVVELKRQLDVRAMAGSPRDRINEIRADGHAMLGLVATDPDRVRRWLRGRFVVVVYRNGQIDVRAQLS